MTKQALIERISKKAKISHGARPRVTLLLRDWEAIQDLVLELSSPNLIKSVKRAREDYQKGYGIPHNFESSR
jgi:hypothetical protein